MNIIKDINFSFFEVLIFLAKGIPFRRESWRPEELQVVMDKDSKGVTFYAIGPQTVMDDEEERRQLPHWTPTRDDMQATDWKIAMGWPPEGSRKDPWPMDEKP